MTTCNLKSLQSNWTDKSMTVFFIRLKKKQILIIGNLLLRWSETFCNPFLAGNGVPYWPGHLSPFPASFALHPRWNISMADEGFTSVHSPALAVSWLLMSFIVFCVQPVFVHRLKVLCFYLGYAPLIFTWPVFLPAPAPASFHDLHHPIVAYFPFKTHPSCCILYLYTAYEWVIKATWRNPQGKWSRYPVFESPFSIL